MTGTGNDCRENNDIFCADCSTWRSISFQDSIVLQSVFTNAREKLSKEWEENDDNEEDEVEDEESITPSSRCDLVLASLSH